MQTNNGNNGFTYTYSSEEQEELKRIRDKYVAREEDKLDRLRRLDRRATERAQMYSITLGIIGTLIMGFGMSLCMTELSLIFGDKQWLAMMTGVAVGLIGCALVALAYPVYNLTLKRERKRIAPEIIRLTDELMK